MSTHTMNVIPGSFPLYVALLKSKSDSQTIDIRPVIAWVERDECFVPVIIDAENGKAYPTDSEIIRHSYGEAVDYIATTDIDSALAKWKKWAAANGIKRQVYYRNELAVTNE